MSSSMITVSALSLKESTMASSTTRQYSAISEHSSVKGTPKAIREWLMSLQADSPVSPSPLQESKPEQTIAETCGPKPSQYFASYNHDSRTWRTCQVCLLTNMPDEYSETWPRAGLMLNGVCYPQPNAERRISAIESGFFATPTAKANQLAPSMMKHASCRKMLPTPNTLNHKDSGILGRDWGGDLLAASKLWPTPAARDWKDANYPSEHNRHTPPLAVHAGGKLNPTWVEWLMGWPLGWTDLKPLEMDKFQQWQQQHGRR